MVIYAAQDRARAKAARGETLTESEVALLRADLSISEVRLP
jgi:hypothetical protein